jgi:WD40 repeat protein
MIWRRRSHETWTKLAPIMIVLCIGLVIACGSYKSTPLASEIQKAAPSPGLPESVPQAGHSETVTSVAFSPDGKTLASGSLDSRIKLWDVSTGKELRTLIGHRVTSVAFSPSGQTLANGNLDNTIELWDAPTGREGVFPLTGHSSFVTSVAFSPDRKILASGSYDDTVKLWVFSTGKELHTLKGHSGGVNSVAFSPDGKILASGSADDTVKLWVVSTGKELRTLKGHSDAINSVAFSPDGKTLASGSADDTVKLWDVATVTELRTLKGHSSTVNSVAFSPDGKTLMSGSGDTTIKLWDVSTGKELRTLKGHSNAVWAVAFCPDEKTLASGSEDHSVKLWDVSTGTELRTLKADSPVFAFSPDGKTLASGSADYSVKVWDVSTGKELRPLEVEKTINWEDQKTVTVPIADLTLTLPAELTDESPSIKPQKNGDVTWTNYDYVWRKNDLTLEVSVHITNWDKDFPPEAGGISPEAMLEQHYAAGEREKSRGEIEEVRYLELDGVKGVFGRVPYPGDENAIVLGWQTFRYHKGKAQSLHIMVKGVRGDLEKLMKMINSARLAK